MPKMHTREQVCGRRTFQWRSLQCPTHYLHGGALLSKRILHNKTCFLHLYYNTFLVSFTLPPPSPGRLEWPAYCGFCAGCVSGTLPVPWAKLSKRPKGSKISLLMDRGKTISLERDLNNFKQSGMLLLVLPIVGTSAERTGTLRAFWDVLM